MWRYIFDLVRQMVTVAEDLAKLRNEVKEIRSELRELSATQTRQHYEIQILKERFAHEREKESLQAEIQRLRAQLQLPPSSSEEKSDK